MWLFKTRSLIRNLGFVPSPNSNPKTMTLQILQIRINLQSKEKTKTMSQIKDNEQSYGHETLTKIGHIIK
jgi:hypothetical protein